MELDRKQYFRCYFKSSSKTEEDIKNCLTYCWNNRESIPDEICNTECPYYTPRSVFLEVGLDQNGKAALLEKEINDILLRYGLKSFGLNSDRDGDLVLKISTKKFVDDYYNKITEISKEMLNHEQNV